MSAARTAPGPRGLPVLGSLPALRRDVLGLILRVGRECGDVARVRLGPVAVHLVRHPDDVEHVLRLNHANYDKRSLTSRMLRRLTGESLLVANDEPWRCARRLMQPAFTSARLASFTAVMAGETAAMLDRWKARAGPVDVASEMMRLTYSIVERILFSVESSGAAGELERAITDALGHLYRGIERGFMLPAAVPSPGNRRFRRALAALDRRVYEIIDDHERRPRDDLLGRLMRAADAEGGPPLTREQLRNETITLLIAGHETTANALTWLFHLLAANPEAVRRIRAELADVLGGAAPGAGDLPRLAVTTMTIQESMRLYPPIWAIVRRSRGDDTLGGYHVPAGSRVIISPYAVHRHPGFWPNAEVFDPDRFAPERSRHVCAYIPFGAGPRLCIGQRLAMMEAQVIAAMVLQRYDLRTEPGHRVAMEPGITLRARHGMRMTVHPAGAPP